MLIDKHNSNEMFNFCTNVHKVLSLKQKKILYEGLAKEYTGFSTWDDFIDACTEYENWIPSRETLSQYLARNS